MRRSFLITWGIVLAASTFVKADDRTIRFIDLNESAAWIPKLTSLPDPFKNQVAQIQAAKKPGQYALEGDINVLLAHFGLTRQAFVMDPESLKQTPVAFRGHVRFNFQASGDCSNFPDHLVLDYKTVDGRPFQSLNAFVRPPWLSPIHELESENPEIYERWRRFSRQHIQEWEAGVDRIPELLQDLEKIIDHPNLVLKDSRRTGKNAGYVFVVKNPANTTNFLRFSLSDQGEFLALPDLVYMTCGGE